MTLASLVRLFALIGVLGAGLVGSVGGYSILVLAALCIACLDMTATICIRNVVVVYYFLVLGIGPYWVVVADAHRVQAFAVEVLAMFLIGVLARRLFSHGPPRGKKATQLTLEIGTPETGGRRAAVMLKVALAVQVVLVGQDISQYGVTAFLSGASLAGNISTYVAAGGLTNSQILTIGGQALTASLVAAYVRVNEPERAYDWRLLIVLMIGMPLIGLQRGPLVINVIVVLFLYRWSTRVRRKRVVSHALVIAIALTVAVVAGVGIGLLRAGALSPTQSSSAASQGVLKGELSPVVVVDDALAPAAPRFHGTGLYVPLLLRYVPRRLAPGKTPNTTIRYMQITYPGALAAGYSLAPTAVGAIVLNYGPLGAYVLALALGFALGASRLPRARVVGYVCLMYFSLYSILRNDPVNSVSFLFVTLVGYWLILAVHRRNAAGTNHTAAQLERAET